MAENLDEI